MGEADFFHRAAHGFGKCDVDLIFEIGAGVRFIRGLRGIRAAEKLAEEVAETRATASASGTGSGPARSAEIEPAEIEMNVFGGSAAIPAAGRRSATGPGDVETKLVVHLALLSVGKDFVGFLNLLEFFLGGFVARIQVGMIFSREFAISGANILHRSLAGDSEKIVVILFSGGCHVCGNR